MITKTTMGVIFNLQILVYWISPWRKKKSFRYTAKIGLWQSFQLSTSFSAARNTITKATEYETFVFLFVYGLSSPSRKIWFQFLSVLAAIIWENSNKVPCTENREGFAVQSSTWPRGAEGEWRVSSWLAILNTREKISYFFSCGVTAFLRARNPCITP